MRRVSCVNVDAGQLYDDVMVAKRPPVNQYLRSCRPKVRAAYRGYRSARVLAAISPTALNQEQRAALVHAYESPTRPIRALREALLPPSQGLRCFFCNISEASTLDHYIPKERFPEFAILPRNLVPCCVPCNLLKGTRVVSGTTARRLFLHPYLDAISPSQFLFLDVAVNQDDLKFRYRLSRPVEMTKYTFAVLKRHVRTLRLRRRYRIDSLVELRGIRAALRTHFQVGQANEVQRQLAITGRSLAEEFGENYWRAVLYLSLASSLPFCLGGFSQIK
jgi:5-methylcytosine-specific restriction endonuclease McrA